MSDSWDSVMNIVNYYGKNEGNFSAVAGPGRFNDPDMVNVKENSNEIIYMGFTFAMFAITK
jgi:hypothetical protein